MPRERNSLLNGGVFISYARSDGRDLALRLRDDLVARGVPVWLDQDAIRGGASWTNEIERGIDASRAVLANLTAGSFVSEVCRAEHMRALRKTKRVVPLLARKDADRPLYLEHLNYRDCSSDEDYRKNLNAVLSDIASAAPVPPLPSEFTRSCQQVRDRITVQPLPPNFVARPSDVERVRQLLTKDSRRRIAGIHGLGGLGKTVLAQAACHDEVIQDAFPDGIVWLGTCEASALETLKEAGRGLGDDIATYGTVEHATNRVRTLLQDRAVLLVLDDVSYGERLQLFRTDEWSAPRVRILFTTRDRTTGLQWASEILSLQSFTPTQSEELLRKWAGRDDEAFAEVAKRVAYLPLGLSIAGAVLSDGVSGKEWLSEAQRVSEIRLDRYSANRDNSLAACFDSRHPVRPPPNRRIAPRARPAPPRQN